MTVDASGLLQLVQERDLAKLKDGIKEVRLSTWRSNRK
jgi:hypothetical protein